MLLLVVSIYTMTTLSFSISQLNLLYNSLHRQVFSFGGNQYFNILDCAIFRCGFILLHRRIKLNIINGNICRGNLLLFCNYISFIIFNGNNDRGKIILPCLKLLHINLYVAFDKRKVLILCIKVIIYPIDGNP